VIKTTTGWLVVGLLLFGVQTTAGAEDGGRSLLLFGPGSSNADGVIAGGYARERLPPKQRPDERVGVTGIPYPADHPFWLTGDGSAAWCPEGGTLHGDLPHLVERARRAMDVLESDKVIDMIDDFERNAACIDQLVQAQDVAELYLLRGLAYHVDGDLELAREDFGRAAGVYPELRWDVGYPPDPQQTYLMAREEVGQQERAGFAWSFSMVADLAVHVDGVVVEPLTRLELSPGPHLVQVQAASELVSTLVRIPAGGNAVLVDRLGATTAVLRGPLDPISAAASHTILAAVAGQWNATEVVVVDTTYRKVHREPAVYRYDVATGEFETLTIIKAIKVPAPPHADHVRIAAGGGLQVEAGADDIESTTHVVLRPSGDFDFRIGPTLTPNGGFDLLMHRLPAASGDGMAWYVTPQLRAGLGVRFRTRVVQPFLGVGVQMRFDKNLGRGVVFGAHLQAALDIVSPRFPGAFLRVHGSVGGVDQAGYIEAGVKVGISL
jgi:hypothetical protein